MQIRFRWHAPHNAGVPTGAAGPDNVRRGDSGADQKREGGPRGEAAATIVVGPWLFAEAGSATVANGMRSDAASDGGGAIAPAAPPTQHGDCAQC